MAAVAAPLSQSGDLTAHLADAKDTIAGWLKDLGVDPSTAESAKSDAGSAASGAVSGGRLSSESDDAGTRSRDHA